MNQKGLAPILIIILVALLGAFVYLVYKNETVSKKDSVSSFYKTTPSNYSSKIYKNEKFGVEFYYDKDSKVVYEGAVKSNVKNPQFEVEFLDNKNINILDRNKAIPYVSLIISSECIIDIGAGLDETKVQVITLGGEEGRYLESPDGPSDFTTIDICVENNKLEYWIRAAFPNEASDSVKSKVRENLKKLISSFKFLNAQENSTEILNLYSIPIYPGAKLAKKEGTPRCSNFSTEEAGRTKLFFKCDTLQYR